MLHRETPVAVLVNPPSGPEPRMIVVIRQHSCFRAMLLLRVVSCGLHRLLVGIVGAVRCGRHHPAHTGHRVAGLRIRIYRRCVVQLVGVHVKCHAVLLNSNHVGRARNSWRRWSNGGCWCRHGVGLLCSRDEHRDHSARCHVRLLSARWVIIAAWHEWLWLVSRLVPRLEDTGVNGTLWDSVQRCTCRDLTRVRWLTSMLVETRLFA